MSKIGSVIALSSGGLAVFTMAYIGVATVQGASVREIPPFSWMARDIPAIDPTSTTPPPIPTPLAPKSELPVVPPMTAGVLGAFVLPSPFDSRELQDLQRRLVERTEEIAEERRALDQRARDLDDWQESLEVRTRELEELRGRIGEGLIPPKATPEAAAVATEQDRASWRAMAALFEDGDLDELATRLVSFEPDEAAQILAGLEPERAAQLLNSLPEADYRRYFDAWRKVKG